jgi:raffinose/stachyose/melibiose transport system permease protein
MLASSLKTTGEIFANPLSLIPETIRLANYVEAWNQANFGTYFRNSVFVGTVSVALILFFGSMAAYVLARFSFPGNRAIYLLFLAGFMIPIRLAIVPLFVMMRDLHLLDTLWSLIVVYIAGGMPFTIFLMVNFFRHIPRDLEDDHVAIGAPGAGNGRSISLPQCLERFLFPAHLHSISEFAYRATWSKYVFRRVLE